MKTYRVWLAETYGAYGSAILVNAQNSTDAKKQAAEFSDKKIIKVEYLPKPIERS